MNSSILAERTAKAMQAIQAEVARLGGVMTPPTGSFRDPATKHALTLEAIAQALKGIGGQESAPLGGAVEVEPVEAVISVVKEPAAPKGKRGKSAPDSDDWAKSGRGKEVGS